MSMGTRYRVQLPGFAAAEFGPADQVPVIDNDGAPQTDLRPWDVERAWDCYKRRMGDAVRRRNHGNEPVISPVVTVPLEAVAMARDGVVKRLADIHNPARAE